MRERERESERERERGRILNDGSICAQATARMGKIDQRLARDKCKRVMKGKEKHQLYMHRSIGRE